MQTELRSCAVWVSVWAAYTKPYLTEFTPQWRPLVIPYQTCWEDIVWEKHGQRGKKKKKSVEKSDGEQSGGEMWREGVERNPAKTDERKTVGDRLIHRHTRRWEDKWADILAVLYNAERKGKRKHQGKLQCPSSVWLTKDGLVFGSIWCNMPETVSVLHVKQSPTSAIKPNEEELVNLLDTCHASEDLINCKLKATLYPLG